MQAHGQLRRPLWDVIKSIGGGRRGQQWVCEQRRPIRNEVSPVAAIEPNQRDGSWKRPESAEAGGRESRGRSGKTAAVHGRTPRHHNNRNGHDAARAPIHGAKGKRAPSRKAMGGADEGTSAEAEGKTLDQATPGVARRVFIKKSEKTRKGRREEAGDDHGNGAFEAIVQDAIASPIDHKASRWPQYKAEENLRPRYFKAYQGTVQRRLMKQVKRYQYQREKYGVQSARDWRSALELLDQATPDGESRHKRRMETASLPEKMQAMWIKPAGEVILEIMKNTGAHIQAVPGIGASGTFNAVSLWGTPSQNEHARLLLPKYVEAAGAERKPVMMYELKSKVVEDPSESLAMFGEDGKEAADSAYWNEQEDMDDIEAELLEDTLDDITNAPSRGPAPIRAVWAPSEVSVSSRPAQWNVLTFSAYVDTLTSPPPSMVRRKVYAADMPRPDRTYVDNMRAELVRTFISPISGPFVSSSALSKACQFLAKHNDFPALRTIFLFLEERQFDFTSSDFDVFFEVAAREESPPNFLYTLRLMLSKGMRPTARTWTMFHLLVSRRFPLDSNVVTETMRRKGFFGNADTVRAVAAGNADRAVAAHLSLRRTVDDFLTECEAKFGEQDAWFSARFVHKVVRVLFERGRTEDAFIVIRRFEALARSKGRQGVNANTLNIALTSSLRDGNIQSALTYLRVFMPPHPSAGKPRELAPAAIGRSAGEKYAIQPDSITLEILFGLACRLHYYNVARVVWRHACARGEVSFKMQRVVEQSLAQSTQKAGLEDPQANDETLWSVLAGKFIVGVDKGLSTNHLWSTASTETVSAPESKSQGDHEQYSSDRSEASEATPPPTPSRPASIPPDIWALFDLSQGATKQWHLARALKRADLDEVGSVAPRNHLVLDVERAWRVDMVWKEEGLGKLKREATGGAGGREAAVLDVFGRMMERGVQVPMVVGDAAGVRQAKGMAQVRARPKKEKTSKVSKAGESA